MRRSWLIHVVLLGGCVDAFGGSNVQIDLSRGTPSQAPASRAPQGNELPSNVHFRLVAVKEGSGVESVFELQRFEIHRLVDPTSPCFIDVGPNVPFPGLHVTQFARKMSERTGITDVTNPPPGATQEQQILQATAVQRMLNLDSLAGEGSLRAVTSASPGGYPPVDASCTGAGLPPPTCIDEASNRRRLDICNEAWRKDKELFEGTDRVLTSPLNGTTFGFVIGVVRPDAPTPVGGAQFVVPVALQGVSEYAIFFHTDDTDDTDDTDEPGTLFLSGRPQTGATRGVTHVHMESPFQPGLFTAEMAIFANLDEDDVHF